MLVNRETYPEIRKPRETTCSKCNDQLPQLSVVIRADRSEIRFSENIAKILGCHTWDIYWKNMLLQFHSFSWPTLETSASKNTYLYWQDYFFISLI